jgi:hypothetical protein
MKQETEPKQVIKEKDEGLLDVDGSRGVEGWRQRFKRQVKRSDASLFLGFLYC